MNHKGANGVCSNCHVGNSASWTCYNCHDPAETERDHDEENIINLAARCVECHPNGND